MKKVLIVDDVKGWRDYHEHRVREIFDDAEIFTAESARDGYNKIMEHNSEPFNIILTDMQMEEDFDPKYAGEWFIEQIKTFSNYKNTKIVIVSAAFNISLIAKTYGVEYLTKQTARNFSDAYDLLKQI